MHIAIAEMWFETRSLEDGVTHIWEPCVKPFYRCNIWHVRGRDRDLLLDSGMGVVSLRDRIAALAERPVMAVASHTHFDHIGSHHEFPERAVHRAEAAIMAQPTRVNTLADLYVSDEIFTALPPGSYSAERYEVAPAPATRLLEDGDVIDLGDRRFEVLSLPGHSPGSIALWESATGTLFSGDTVYDGPLIDDCYHSNVDDYVESMERLRDLPVRIVHGGHFPSFGPERYRTLIDEYVAGKRRPGCPAEVG
ncbi:MBL fold metallo-hydrolase [Rhodospirillaceae bacterium SYSU D60014]|uniref:MBL fold metallo-hydrolase n=1 Tax=Virgifigura deserti TaxID=2268457 RepID=UPI000E666281